MCVFENDGACDIDQLRDMHQALKTLVGGVEMKHALLEVVGDSGCRKQVDSEEEGCKHELSEDVQVAVPMIQPREFGTDLTKFEHDQKFDDEQRY